MHSLATDHQLHTPASHYKWVLGPQGVPKPIVPDAPETPVVWAPMPGSQQIFLDCPVREVIYEGNRGPGKTDALLMDFAQHVGRGLGAAWNGILIRRGYKELQDVIRKAKKWFPRIFPKAKYNEAKTFWQFPDGEVLSFRHLRRPEDYGAFHGHEYPWIGFEELTNWPSDEGYKIMLSLNRTSDPRCPLKIRSTTNPYGVGHNWVKRRFHLPVPRGRVVGDIIKTPGLPDRVAIHAHLYENILLMAAQPDYEDQIRASARNAAQLAAWLHGDWDIVAGGMFDDIWEPPIHVVPRIPYEEIPISWKIDRAYDHGQARPFSVGWWAESSGEPIRYGDRVWGEVPGDLFRFEEWYGWTGNDNEGLRMSARDIARGIREREHEMGVAHRVVAGIADSSIFDKYDGERSVAGDMAKEGILWEGADKGRGSRKQGWEQIRDRLRGSIPVPADPDDETSPKIRERPGLFISEGCRQCLRTLPVLPRSEKDPDDADTEAEDHIPDEVRYRVRAKVLQIAVRSF